MKNKAHVFLKWFGRLKYSQMYLPIIVGICLILLVLLVLIMPLFHI